MAGVMYVSPRGVADRQILDPATRSTIDAAKAAGVKRVAAARGGGVLPGTSSTTMGLGTPRPAPMPMSTPTALDSSGFRTTLRRVGQVANRSRAMLSGGLAKAGAAGAAVGALADNAVTPTERYADRFGFQGDTPLKYGALRGLGFASDLGNAMTFGQAGKLYRDRGNTYPGEMAPLGALPAVNVATSTPAYRGITSGPTNPRGRNARSAPPGRSGGSRALPSEVRMQLDRSLEDGQGVIVGARGRVAGNVPGVRTGPTQGALSIVDPFRESTAADPTTHALANAALIGDGGALKGALSDAIARGDYQAADMAVRNPEERAQLQETQARGALMKDITNRVRAGQPVGEQRLALAQQFIGTPHADPQGEAIGRRGALADLQTKEMQLQSVNRIQQMVDEYTTLDNSNDPTGERRDALLSSILAAQGKTQDPRYKGYETGGGLYDPKGVAVLDTRSGELRTAGQQAAMPKREDIEYTARKYGVSVDEVMRQLGIDPQRVDLFAPRGALPPTN